MVSENIDASSPSAATDNREAKHKGKLSNFMIANIWMLSFMGVASAFILLLGNFEGKFIRVFSTLLLFVVFTILTAKDTSSKKPHLAIPIALGGNVYMLGLSLMLIWATLAKSGFDDSFMLPKMLFLIVIIKVAVAVIQKISYLIFVNESQLSLIAKVTMVALIMTTILYTLPLGVDHLFEFGSFYWKFAVFVTILAGLSLSITALIFWSFKDKLEPELIQEFIKPKNVYVQSSMNESSLNPAIPTHNNPNPKSGSVVNTVSDSSSVPNTVESRRPDMPKPSESIQPPVAPVISPQQPMATPVGAVPQVSAPGLPVYAPVAVAPLKWPVFPDGSPVPANAAGRPDFRALESMAIRLKQLENQWMPKADQ
jgi:hypothetical protein